MDSSKARGRLNGVSRGEGKQVTCPDHRPVITSQVLGQVLA